MSESISPFSWPIYSRHIYSGQGAGKSDLGILRQSWVSKTVVGRQLEHAYNVSTEISRTTITYMSVVREAKAVQVQNGNVSVSIFYLYVGSNLVAQFLVNTASVIGFGKLVWHRTTKDQVLVKAGRPSFHRYIYIKAPSNLLVLCFDNTSVLIAQSQVMPNKAWIVAHQRRRSGGGGDVIFIPEDESEIVRSCRYEICSCSVKFYVALFALAPKFCPRGVFGRPFLAPSFLSKLRSTKAFAL